MQKVLRGYSGGRLLGRSAKERGREEEEEEKDSRGRHVRFEIAQEVVAGINDKAGVHEDAKAMAQRTAGQSVKQAGTARKSKIKKRRKRKSGKRKTRWKCNGRKMGSWRRFGTKKDGRKLLAGGSHAKSTRVCGF